MAEFIAMLGSAPGPRLGSAPSPRRQFPDFSVQSVAMRGNLRGLAGRGYFSGLGAESGSDTDSKVMYDVTKDTKIVCSPKIPFPAIVALVNDRVKDFLYLRKTRKYSFKFAYAELEQEINPGTDKASYKFNTNSDRFRDFESFNKKNELTGSGLFRWQLSLLSMNRVKQLVELYMANKELYDSNVNAWKNICFNNFILNYYVNDPPLVDEPEVYITAVAAGYVGIQRPGLVKLMADNWSTVEPIFGLFNNSDVSITGRKDGQSYGQNLLDYVISSESESSPEVYAGPEADVKKFGDKKWPELVMRVLGVASAISHSLHNPSRTANMPPIMFNVTEFSKSFLTEQYALEYACSFDSSLLQDPTQRGFVSTQARDAAITEAEARAREEALKNCDIKPGDNAVIDARINKFIVDNGLKTPEEVQSTVDDVTKGFKAIEKKLKDKQTWIIGGAALLIIGLGYLAFRKK